MVNTPFFRSPAALSRSLMPLSLRALVCVLAAFLLAALGARPAAAQGYETNPDALPTVTRTFAIENARVVQQPGRVLERATVVIRDGRILSVGPDAAVPADAERIDGDSLTVYAGFIDGLSHAGLPETSSDDEGEEEVDDPGDPPRDRAGIQPGRRATALLDPSSGSLAALRKAGFTAAHVVPRGQMLPGTGAVILLAGEDPSGLVLREDASLFAQFEPAEGSYPNAVYPSTPMAVTAEMRQLYREAERQQQLAARYADNPAGRMRPTRDALYDAFSPVLGGERTVFYDVQGALEPYRALALQRELGFPLALTGLNQAYAFVDALESAGVPLFLTLDLPEAPSDTTAQDTTARPVADTLATDAVGADTLTTAADTTKGITEQDPNSFFVRDFRTRSYEDASDEKENLEARQALEREKYYATAATLREAGLSFGFSTKGAKPGDLRKNLRTMIEHGLSEEDALAALTTDAAALLGLERVLGTIEEGKIANLVVTEGPYFSDSSRVRYVFVDGQKFEMEVEETAAAGDSAATAAGTWRFTVDSPQGPFESTLIITGAPGRFEGTIETTGNPEPAPLQDVTLSGSRLRFRVQTNQFGEATADFTIDGDAFSGTFTVVDVGPVPATGTRTGDPER